MSTVLRLGASGAEVRQLQELLNKTGHFAIALDGEFGKLTEVAVKTFQTRYGIVPDGVVGPVTLNALQGGAGYKNAAVTAVVGNKKLTDADFVKAAQKLGVSVAHVRAVCTVEAGSTGFLSDGRPKILFERHYFYKLCPAAKRVGAPLDICNPTSGGYVGNSAEWTRLERAMLFDTAAALESASWGLFQIMGSHWKRLGYTSVMDMVARMKQSEGEQLDAFVRFVLTDKKLHNALKASQWATFARIYNGPAYAKNQYDIKMAIAFKKWSKV